MDLQADLSVAFLLICLILLDLWRYLMASGYELGPQNQFIIHFSRLLRQMCLPVSRARITPP